MLVSRVLEPLKPSADSIYLVWDCKPERKEDPIHWVELKTSAEIRNDRDMLKYERKLLKFWAQSFLLGVPKIIVGFRDQDGIVHRLEELETASIPGKVKKLGRGSWDGNICINFAAAFLECKGYSLTADVRADTVLQGLNRLFGKTEFGEFENRRSLRSLRSSKLKSRDTVIYSRLPLRPGDHQ